MMMTYTFLIKWQNTFVKLHSIMLLARFPKKILKRRLNLHIVTENYYHLKWSIHSDSIGGIRVVQAFTMSIFLHLPISRYSVYY
ncbi:hypothetical protein BC351_21675 [Paenibacillus ferrarius]|uniref:Uncharacterized protein n=1 Tax=Paenibacillus ferrarius TaxID=1469647 RepID=A0A1V4HMQ2_9BACL|nr:hypothetical protein BC351_21675 [Paenibacillus ferrarius]